MTNKDFVHLHVHTEFSLLDGLSKIDKLVDRAKALNMGALAITDHGTMFGVMDFYRACKAADVKPIIGVEAYLASRRMTDRDPKLDRERFHMLLLAKNQQGYQNLLKIASAAQLDGYYYKPRIDREFLAAHSEGLIATSGCLAAEIPRMVASGNDDAAHELIGWYQEVFGAENFFLELQQHDIPELFELNKWLVNYRASGHSAVQLVATNDVHYVMETDFDPHDTLLCIQTSALKREQNRMRMTDPSYHLTTQQQMWGYFHEVPEALHNTLKIAEMCEINLDDKEYHLPIFPVPAGYDAGSYLRYLCEIGLEWRFGDRKDDPVLRKRLDRELGIIHDMGFDTYFLIVWDLCQFARHADIWWNVRGSGAGSLAAYCLSITNIDPIQNSLLFERFLNPGRVSMPDIDLDYPDDRRAEMIAYTAQKYGEEKVAAIITFGTMGAKASVRDVGRALDVDLSKVNLAAGLIPQEARQKKLMDYVHLNSDLEKLYNEDAEIRQIIDTGKELQGINRHASTHAAGVIVADKPLIEYLPLHRITGTDPSGGALKAVTQFPMETCESIGLLKIDFLGLSTLTILRKACELIARHRGISYTMDNIPYRHGDPRITLEQVKMLDAAFDMMGRGETVGVFQVESTGMQQMLRGMRPRRFENIIAGISLYRPGPMEFIPQYNQRLHGEEAIEYRHPKLESILAETYGILVYQEQIMQVAGDLFGYELGEADLMRRAVSKKKEKDLKKHRTIFLERGPENGIDEDAAGKIFDDIEFFANYGFNKSHAADYAVITVQTAFLKCHYPEEYVTALLHVQSDNTDKISTFLEECRRLEIPVLPPDVNYSQVNFDIEILEDGRRGIRFGMGAVKNASVNAIELLIEARGGKPFTDLEDFCKRIDLRKFGKRTIESLIRVGAFHKFGTRATLIAAIDRLVSYSGNYHKDKEVGQMTMFSAMGSMSEDMLGNLPNVEEVGVREMLGWERELLGLYVTGRPVDRYKADLAKHHTRVINDLKMNEGPPLDKPILIAGEIMELRTITTRTGQLMAIAHVEDWHDTAGAIDVVFFPRTWEKVRTAYQDVLERPLGAGEIVMIKGQVDLSRGDVQIIGEEVKTDFNLIDPDDNPLDQADDRELNWLPPEDADTVSLTSGNGAIPDFNEVGEIEKPHQPPPLDDGEPDAPSSEGGVAFPLPSFMPRFEDMPPWVVADGDLPEFDLNDDSDYQERWIMVYFQRSDDPNKDRRRLRKLHGIMVSYPGRDRFSIVIETPKKPLQMDFPNHTTGYCPALLNDLSSVVGIRNIEIYIAPDE